MRKPVPVLVSALAVSGSLLAACTADLDTTSPSVTTTAIIGGSRAPGFAAVGHVFPMSNPHDFCTATLVAPSLVLTAKHCVFNDNGDRWLDIDVVSFTLADTNDSSKWTDAVQIVDVALAPQLPAPANDDLYFMRSDASDVAVYLLDHPITTVTPLAVGADLPGPANAAFTGVGFGRVAHDGTEAVSLNSGPLTFRQNGGSQLKTRFGTLANYLAEVHRLSPNFSVDRLTSDFNHEILAQDYEMWFDAPGNMQVCNGDSGGPLLKQNASGAWEVYGVVSGSKSYGDAHCYFGSVYSTFGPETRAFLDDQLTWPL